MLVAIIVIFGLAYVAIALEHPLRINKSATALVAAGILWTLYAALEGPSPSVARDLDETLAATAQIVFFLMGAMTIVEVIDAHDGFDVITAQIRTRSEPALFWIVGLISFFLSAVLDNLTTTIVMVSLLRRLMPAGEQRLLFAGLIVIAANAGGAWSPIGDVTTTMLWIGGQVSAPGVVQGLIVPSLVNLIVPLSIIAWVRRGRTLPPADDGDAEPGVATSSTEARLMLGIGIGALVAVPAFKAVTGLPPFLGMLFALGLVWLIGELLHRDKADDERRTLTLAYALTRIDMSSLAFFIGILLSVATLEHTHVLASLAEWLSRTVERLDVIVILIGLFSAVIDNVPLVAASMGMFDLAQHPTDSFLWEFLAYCAGTGGSILVIGSAAGVAAMGIERIDFLWYARRIGTLALAGYLAGAATYLLQPLVLAP